MSSHTCLAPAVLGREAHKVLFFSDAPYEGGAERYIEYLIEALPETWSAAVVARSRAELDPFVERLGRRGVKVFRSPDSALGSLHSLWDAIRAVRPDVVHLNLPHSYSAHYSSAAPLARAAGARAVVTTEHLTMITPMRLRGHLRRAMTGAVDRIITLSESNRRDLTDRHKLPSNRIRIVYNGVPDPEPVDRGGVAALRQALGAAPGEPLIVHVGALTERKGHRFLLDAAATLTDVPWRLALVGEGEEDAALREHTGALGLSNRVFFAGHRDDVPEILAASDLVVLPSRLEGVPLVLLEALAMGRPAIATRIYGVPEIYAGSDAARLVDYGDVPGLAAELRSLTSDPDLRQRMGRDARRLYTERFTSAKMAGETLSVYAEVLN